MARESEVQRLTSSWSNRSNSEIWTTFFEFQSLSSGQLHCTISPGPGRSWPLCAWGHIHVEWELLKEEEPRSGGWEGRWGDGQALWAAAVGVGEADWPRHTLREKQPAFGRRCGFQMQTVCGNWEGGDGACGLIHTGRVPLWGLVFWGFPWWLCTRGASLCQARDGDDRGADYQVMDLPCFVSLS